MKRVCSPPPRQRHGATPGEGAPDTCFCYIEMVPTEQVAQVVAQIGGPPEYVDKNWDRLVGTAQHLAELKCAAG